MPDARDCPCSPSAAPAQDAEAPRPRLHLCDTTLRDGEQAPGVAFTKKEKVHIARLLDELGVDEIEAGTAVMGGDERESLAEIASLGLRARVIGWNRARLTDIDASIACGVQGVAVSLPTSDLHIRAKLGKDRSWVLDTMRRAVSYAKSNGLYVVVGAEDASRSDPDFVSRYASAAEREGADRIRYCDTVGVAEPFSLRDAFTRLRAECRCELEVHAHQDLGLAVANTLAAVRAGAGWASVTVCGLGERAGNAPLEQVVMATRCLAGPKTRIDTNALREVALSVMGAAGRPVEDSRPVVGAAVFTHESGIHADGVLKDARTYESFAPAEVGLERRIVIGKHTGSRAVRMRLAECGVKLTDAEARALLPAVRAMSCERKRALHDHELCSLARSRSRPAL